MTAVTGVQTRLKRLGAQGIINPLDKESSDAYASDFPRRRRNGSRFREPGLGAILSAAAALWLRRSAIWLQQRLRPERLWAVRFDPGAAQPGRAAHRDASPAPHDRRQRGPGA